MQENHVGPSQQSAPIQTSNKLVGKWSIDSVTTVFRDSTGKTLGKSTYIQPGWYFQFNNDKSWSETLSANNLTDLASSGTFVLNSDTSFTLTNASFNIIEPCKIFSISSSSFVFSHRRSVVFNGVTPGTGEYILALSK